MRRLWLLLIVCASLCVAQKSGARQRILPKFEVSEEQAILVDQSGKPVSYLADTAWELFHRLDRKQVVQYLDLRASQRYTAIQSVILAELDGVTDPNPYGDLLPQIAVNTIIGTTSTSSSIRRMRAACMSRCFVMTRHVRAESTHLSYKETFPNPETRGH